MYPTKPLRRPTPRGGLLLDALQERVANRALAAALVLEVTEVATSHLAVLVGLVVAHDVAVQHRGEPLRGHVERLAAVDKTLLRCRDVGAPLVGEHAVLGDGHDDLVPLLERDAGDRLVHRDGGHMTPFFGAISSKCRRHGGDIHSRPHRRRETDSNPLYTH